MVEVRLIFCWSCQTVNQGFRSRRTTRHINVYRHDTVGTAHDGIGIMIVAAAVGTRTHRQHPTRLGELVVYAAQGGGHFIGERTRHNHQVGLTGRRTENNAETVKVVTRHTRVHHFHGAAGQTESNRPQRTGTHIVQHRIRAGGDETFFQNAFYSHSSAPFFHS